MGQHCQLSSWPVPGGAVTGVRAEAYVGGVEVRPTCEAETLM